MDGVAWTMVDITTLKVNPISSTSQHSGWRYLAAPL